MAPQSTLMVMYEDEWCDNFEHGVATAPNLIGHMHKLFALQSYVKVNA